MPSTYTLNNGITLIATGEQSGTWGATTNVNLELVDAALDGQVTVTLASAGSSGSPNALAISDGAASNGRNRMVIFDDGGDLGATAYVQLTPNDSEKIIYVRNALSGSRSILLFQGTYNASNDYEVPAGTTAVVYFNGAGTGAVAANVFNNAYFDSLRLGSVSVTAILDEDNMSSDSATALATQQSIKAYVDSQVGTVDTLAEILANGNTTGGTNIVVSSGDVITTNTINETTAASGVTIDSLLVKDGGITAAGTSTFAGQTITNLGAVTTADINGGTIDGTVIGGSSAAAGTFTTFTSTGIDDNATSTAITIDSSENVGIGTTAPTHMLTVGEDNSNNPGQISLGRGGLETANIFFTRAGTNDAEITYNSDEDLYIKNNFAAGDVVYSNNLGAHIFKHGSAGASEAMRITSSGLVGIGNQLPSYLLDLYKAASTVARIRNSAATGGTPSTTHGEFVIESTDANMGMEFLGSTTADQRILFSDTAAASGQIVYNHTSNYMALFTATEDRLHITSSGRVGIGTTVPGEKLHVSTGGSEYAIQWNSTGSNNWVLGSASNRAYIANKSTPLEVLTLLNGGNVGIGINNPAQFVQISKATAAGTTSLLVSNPAGTGGSSAALKLGVSPEDNSVAKFAIIHERLAAYGGGDTYFCSNYAANTTEVTDADAVITIKGSTGNVGIGRTSPTYELDVDGAVGMYAATTETRNLEIGHGRTGNGFSYIDLVGDATYSTYGLRVLRGNTGANTGTSLTHRGTGNFSLNSFDAGSISLLTSNAERLRIESGGVVRPGADNTQTLGSASFRWSVVYAGTGTINTSDEREKQQIADLDDAERRVAVAIKGLVKKYKYNDAVALKGDDARIHVGVIAQEVIAAFAAEGLDATRYALLCHDTWEAEPEETDDEGNVINPGIEAGERYGIRYDELLAFMIAAL